MKLTPKCVECKQHFVYKIKIEPRCVGHYCELAHALLRDINVCLKEMSIEKIRESCKRSKPKTDARKMDTCHLDPDRDFICWVRDPGDLLSDGDFQLREEFLTEEGRKHILHEK